MAAEDYIFPKGFLDPGIDEWVQECRRLYPEWFALADDLNFYAIKVMSTFDVHNGELQELLLSALYVRCLHTFQGAVLMAERGMITPGRMLARCMVEAIFQLVAISKDKAFAQEYADTHIIHRLKSFRKLQKFGSPEVNEEKNLERVKELEAEKAALGFKNPTSVEDWAKRAELHTWYLTAYAHLSDSVHSNVGDLEEYLVLNADGKVQELKWWSREDGIDVVLMTVIEGMTLAIEHTASITKMDTVADLKHLKERLRTLLGDHLLVDDRLQQRQSR